MAQPSFVCLYLDYMETFAPYTDAERGRLVTAMLQYAGTGAIPEFSGNERYVWPLLQGQIERDRKKYFDRCEKNRRNGLKGGRPRLEESEPENTPVALPEGAYHGGHTPGWVTL